MATDAEGARRASEASPCCPRPSLLGLASVTLTRRPEQFHLAQEALTPKAASRALAEPILLPTRSVALVGRRRYGGHFHWQ